MTYLLDTCVISECLLESLNGRPHSEPVALENLYDFGNIIVINPLAAVC